MFSYHLKSVTFSDGTTINLEPGAVLVLVGPNGSGKSLALKEIDRTIGNQPCDHTAIAKIDPETIEKSDAFADWLEESYASATIQGRKQYHTVGYGVEAGQLLNPGSNAEGPFLCHRLGTEQRLNLVHTTESINVFHEPPSRYIHALQADDDILNKVSSQLREAFNVDLIPYRAGRHVWFHVGDEPSDHKNNPVSRPYNEALQRLPKLDDEGDGIRSFVGALLAAQCGPQPVLLVDEPEAFLHPPQARRIARFLAQTALDLNRQVIVATHSSDVLQGCLETSPRVSVCRIVRDGNVNRVSVLSAGELKQLWSKPLLRSSSATDGVFHDGVVICEGDSDCRFYEGLLREVEKGVEGPADYYFVHGGGKGALRTLAQAYSRLSVPQVVIADLDLLQNEEEFFRLYELLGGSRETIKSHYDTLRAAFDLKKPLSGEDFVRRVELILQKVRDAGKLTAETRREFEELLAKTRKWGEIKRLGVRVLQSTNLTAAQRLLEQCRNRGLFLVPNGQLESWWPEGPADKG